MQLMQGTDGLLSRRLAALDLAALDGTAVRVLVAEEARAVLGGEHAVVWRYDSSMNRLERDHDGRGGRFVELPTSWVGSLSSPERWTGEEEEIRARLATASFGGGDRAGSVLAIPLFYASELLAVALVHRPSYGETDVDTSGLAAQAASVLHNHGLLSAARKSQAQLAALYETAGELSSRLDLETVLAAIVERARLLVGAPISYIMLVDESSRVIYMRVTRGTTDRGFSELRLKLGEGLGGVVADRRRPLYSSDYLNEPGIRHQPEVDGAVRAEGVKSILGVPLVASNRFVGVLYVADRQVRAFENSDTELLTSLADHAAVALENAALYERATDALAEVERTNEVISAQYRRLQRAEALNSELSRVLLAGEGLTAVVQLMASFLGERVFVVDEHERTLADAGAPGDRFGKLMMERGPREALARARVSLQPDSGANGSTTVVPACAPDRLRVRVVVPLVARAEVLGALWAELRPDALEEDRPLVEQAARVVALDVLKEHAIAETERRLGSELLSELLATPVGAGVRRRARELGVDLRDPHRIAVFAIAASTPTGRADAVNLARAETIRRLRRESSCVFVAERGSRIVGLVGAEHDGVRESLEGLLAQVPGGGAVVGGVVSAVCDALEDYGREFVACDRILGVLPRAPSVSVVDLEEARVLGLLFREGGEEELERFVGSRLRPLLDHDGQHGLCLIGTLEAYLASSGSPGQTAARLHVHVNTVYYRLGRIKELLGEQFGEPRFALDLQIALLARHLVASRGSLPS